MFCICVCVHFRNRLCIHFILWTNDIRNHAVMNMLFWFQVSYGILVVHDCSLLTIRLDNI